jgi:K+-sensing histidine kinase KdpD
MLGPSTPSPPCAAFFFLPPHDTFVIGQPEYVVVLFVNLGISVLISLLLGRATDRAAAAEARGGV